MNVEQLKKAKKERHMTYEQLSAQSGVPLSTIYDLFRGVTTAPRIDTVEAIERALGLSNDITAENITNGWVGTKKESIMPDEDDMLYYYREISMAKRLSKV